MATTLTVVSFGRGNTGGTAAIVDIDTQTTAADSTGNNWTNTGRELFYINNGGASSITITLTLQGKVDGQTGATNPTVAVAAGKRALIGAFPVTPYNDSNQKMNVTYSAVTSVTVAAVLPANA